MPAGQPQKAIYALCCPHSGAVKYIGASNNPENRLKRHTRERRRNHFPVYRWIAKLQREGHSPKLAILHDMTADWEALEIQFISDYRSKGKLYNVADGGDMPYCDEELRSKNGFKLNKILQAASPTQKRFLKLKRLLRLPNTLKHMTACTRIKLYNGYLRHPDKLRCFVDVLQ